MAWERIPLTKLARVASRFLESGKKIADQLEAAKAGGLTEIVFQIKHAEKCAAGAVSAASLADLHIPDQMECLITGDTPLWQQNQTKAAANKARAAAKPANDAATGVTAATAKKKVAGAKKAATKKKGTT